jgi:hypothetical protein
MSDVLDVEGLFVPGGQACPYCGYAFELASCANSPAGEPVMPDEGDVNICINCLLVSRFAKRGHAFFLRPCQGEQDLNEILQDFPVPHLLRPYGGCTTKGHRFETFRVMDPKLPARAEPGGFLEVFTLGRVTG